MSASVVVSARQALADRLYLIDVRDEASYLAGHVPGAVRLDIKSWEQAGKAADTDFRNTAFWAARIGELGISSETTIAVYDAGGQTEAARVWFILQLFGAKASIVDGGWRALRDALADGVQATPVQPRPQIFLPSTHKPGVGVYTRHSLRDHIARGGVQVFDARTPQEFAGEDARGNARTGHLPGARNISHTDLIDANGILKPVEELRALFAAAGLKQGEPIVTHCQGGGRAALAAAAAVQAGFGDVHAYYLSFGDWAADESCPIVR